MNIIMNKVVRAVPLFFLFLALPCFSQGSPLSLFNQANAYYEKGEYAKAIELYESLAQERQVNAALYYNLGNAYYRAQQPGKAIVNYERALRFAPRDSDIRTNLEFVRRAVQEPGPGPGDEVIAWFDGLITLNELTVLCSALLLLCSAGLGIFIVKRRQRFLLSSAAIAALFLLSGAWLGMKISNEVSTRWAVVIAGPADVRNGPGTENSVGFSLPEGRKVMILGHKDDWVAIGLRVEGLKGWIEKKYIEAVER